jgi:methionine synthase II (cobalamin-independent)
VWNAERQNIIENRIAKAIRKKIYQIHQDLVDMWTFGEAALEETHPGRFKKRMTNLKSEIYDAYRKAFEKFIKSEQCKCLFHFIFLVLKSFFSLFSDLFKSEKALRIELEEAKKKIESLEELEKCKKDMQHCD